MDSPQFNMNNPAVKRIMREVREFQRSKSSQCDAAPLEDNIFEWHFTIRGAEGTDFSGGIYHGRILLPAEYPMKPPNIVLLTPNGRFEVGTKICLSVSAHHPEEWKPSWGVRTILVALIGFMPTKGAGAIGAIDCSSEVRAKLAKESQKWACPKCGVPSLPETDDGQSEGMDMTQSMESMVFTAKVDKEGKPELATPQLTSAAASSSSVIHPSPLSRESDVASFRLSEDGTADEEKENPGPTEVTVKASPAAELSFNSSGGPSQMNKAVEEQERNDNQVSARVVPPSPPTRAHTQHVPAVAVPQQQEQHREQPQHGNGMEAQVVEGQSGAVRALDTFMVAILFAIFALLLRKYVTLNS